MLREPFRPMMLTARVAIKAYAAWLRYTLGQL